MKTLFKTHKFPLLIVAATLLIFAGLLPILPDQMASHLLGSGVANEQGNKFLVFLLFAVADIGISLLISSLIFSPGRMLLMANQALKTALTLYFPLLMACILVMLVMASFGQNGIAVLIGFHLLYLAALAAIILKK